MDMVFRSRDELESFWAEMQLIRHEKESKGEIFFDDEEEQKYYPVFDKWRREQGAFGWGPDGYHEAIPRITGNNSLSSPDLIHLCDFNSSNLPQLPEVLIEGILRKKRKLLLAGPSKAGKTGLLIELALAIASGTKWLGFQCTKGRVLYFDLENDRNTTIRRFFDICTSMLHTDTIPNGLEVINWRGKTKPLDELVEPICSAAAGYDVIILDPMYKIITGDENNATDMSYFCRQIDEIISLTGSTVIYCHHHSKGSQGQKKAMDRASGSGVFARDADALLDIIELGVTKNYRRSTQAPQDASAWRMEFTLREFPQLTPVSFWHVYPVHTLDASLDALHPLGSREANLAASKKRASPEDKKEHAEKTISDIFTAFDKGNTGMVELSKVAEEAHVSTKTIQRYVKLLSSEYANPPGSGMVVKLGTKAAVRFGL